MKTINTYIFERLTASSAAEIEFDKFSEAFKAYAKPIDLKQFNLNVEYHKTELYIFDSFIYDTDSDQIYVLAHNKSNKEQPQMFKLRDIHDWINYFVLGLNLPERQNEKKAVKQIKDVMSYLSSKEAE